MTVSEMLTLKLLLNIKVNIIRKLVCLTEINSNLEKGECGKNKCCRVIVKCYIYKNPVLLLYITLIENII